MNALEARAGQVRASQSSTGMSAISQDANAVELLPWFVLLLTDLRQRYGSEGQQENSTAENNSITQIIYLILSHNNHQTKTKMKEQNDKPIESTIIIRDGMPPLRFKCDRYWEADNRTHNSTRWSVFTIYRTVGGRYVVKVKRISKWQGEFNECHAWSFDNAKEVINKLRDEDMKLGMAECDVIARAAKDDENFAAEWIEDIE